MGLVVLDETALFGSSIPLNFEEPVAWQRFAEHYDGLVLRDRNHPSVLGWSFGNELFAIFDLNRMSRRRTPTRWYRATRRARAARPAARPDARLDFLRRRRGPARHAARLEQALRATACRWTGCRRSTSR